MEIMNAILARRAVRGFSSTPVPSYVVDEMLEAARHSPSGGNGQTYRFGVIDDPRIITRLAEAAGEQMWISSAPLVIACCADISWDLGAVPEDDFAFIVNVLRFGREMVNYLNAYGDRRAVGKLLANATPLIAAEHMYLIAVSHGLQGCFIGYLDTEKASEILNLPETISCLFLLPIGYPAVEPAPKPKKSAAEISFRNQY